MRTARARSQPTPTPKPLKPPPAPPADDYSLSVIGPDLLAHIKSTRRSRRAAVSSSSLISVPAYTRAPTSTLPKTLLIYEHLRHIETACTYASSLPISTHHRAAASRAVAALRRAFKL